MKFSLLIVCGLILSLNANAQFKRSPMKNPECQKMSQIRELKFLEKFLPDLEGHKKKATTRRGIRCLSPGMRVKALTPEGKIIGMLIVTTANVIKFSEISPRLARAENTTVEGLKKGLVEIYGPEIKKQLLTAIEFTWLPNTKFNRRSLGQ